MRSDPDGWAWQVAAAMRRRAWLAEQQVEVERRIERLLMAMPPAAGLVKQCPECGGCCLEHGEGHAPAAYVCPVHISC